MNNNKKKKSGKNGSSRGDSQEMFHLSTKSSNAK
jgi:hypothetical protein